MNVVILSLHSIYNIYDLIPSDTLYNIAIAQLYVGHASVVHCNVGHLLQSINILKSGWRIFKQKCRALRIFHVLFTFEY